MKRFVANTLVILAAALALAGCGHQMRQDWTALIDGDKGMDNWTTTGVPANWRAEGGAILADKSTAAGKGAGILVSKKSYKDFELYVEFWAADDTNSGVYLRAPDPNNVNTASGAYEVQIWDKNPNPAYSTGSLVNVASVSPIHKAGGRWNTFEIYAVGSTITVKMNGTVTAAVQDARNVKDGRLAIQFNGGPIKVRKMLVKEL